MRYFREIIIVILVIIIGIGVVLWYKQNKSFKKMTPDNFTVPSQHQEKQNVDNNGHPIGAGVSLGFTGVPPLSFNKPIIWKNYVSKDGQVKFPYPDGATIIDNPVPVTGGEYIAVNFGEYGIADIQTGDKNIEAFLTNIKTDISNVQMWDLVDSMKNHLGTFYTENNKDGSISNYYLFDNSKQKVLVSDEAHDANIDDFLRYSSSYLINHLVIK